MWVYLKSEPGLWTVGHYGPSGMFLSESDHSSTDEASKRVNYLNGGGPGQLEGQIKILEVLQRQQKDLMALRKCIEALTKQIIVLSKQV